MPQVEKYIEVDAAIDDCFKMWLDVTAYPLFIKNLETVRKTDSDNTWIWTIWIPIGRNEEWEVQIDDIDTSWYALNAKWGAYRCNFVMKTIKPDRTAISIILEYIPGPEAIRECSNRIVHFPQHILDIDLKQLKSLIEHPVRSKILTTTNKRNKVKKPAHHSSSCDI